MKKNIVFAIVYVLFGLTYGSAIAEETKEAHKPHQHRHDQYAHMKNPVPGTAQSIAEGKKLYEKHCRACHGESGKGGVGPDLTDAVWVHGNTDGEIFNAITGGAQGTAMRGFKKELPDEARWHLVNYLVSLRSGTKGGR
ncbi:MAG: c-type cytochrome [Nitrospirota bacterium]